MEPTGATDYKGNPKKLTYRDNKGGLNTHLSNVSTNCDYYKRTPTHTYITSPPKEDGVLRSPQLIQ